MKIAVVGRGKLGSALVKALHIAEQEVVDDPLTSDLIILCVPDDVIPTVSAAFAGHPMVHTSGTNAAEILAGDGPKASMHPIQTVRSGADADVFQGVHVSLEGDSELMATLSDLVVGFGAIPLHVSAAQKMAIHLAAVMVSNFTVALHLAADDVLMKAGVDSKSADLFRVLMDRTMENIRTVGPRAARTGPAARGDEETMRQHRELLKGDDASLAAYRALSEWIVRR